jgi:hypothetical protein
MSTLNPEKLQVKFIGDADPEKPANPRRYTLTHSDTTGDLFLSIGTDYDYKAISGLYTRIMRDEVVAELLEKTNGPELHVYCHVSGGLVLGGAKWRYEIFQRHMRQVLQAFRYGDDVFYTSNPSYDSAKVKIHFRSTNSRFNLVENWGSLIDYARQDDLIYAET